ncbi:MAG: hypothetical protein OEV45_03725 [Desulfobacteraceae bacterium]|nr:hypothetical protein [Desulfobacteraceae bacterium]
MTENSLDRKLRAIFSADVKGYSRLMGEDEEHTVKTITAYRKTISDLIFKHKGRVVDSPGDNLLAEFASTLDAVNSAIEIQETLKEKNADLPDNRKMVFRIGINLGDIIHEGDRIYGDGVNVAARIEGLADPGGVCISRNVYDQVKKKLTKLGYEYIGAHDVKNISGPVRVYKILIEPEYAGKVIGEETPKPAWPRTATAALVVLAIVACALAFWNFYTRRTSIEPASVEKMAFPLPDKPSIAILPFVNMSDDPKQEYFSDGLTEEIITALSKVRRLFVIARNSSFTYKGKSLTVQQIGRELGVRFVLEGSVRRAGDKVRITAQLVDATTGNHLWAERYDRNLTDIFAIQDEVTKEIITAMNVELTEGEQAQLAAKATDNLESYLKFMQARENIYHLSIESIALAKKLAEEAIALDPEYASAYRLLGVTYMHDALLGTSKSPKQSLTKAIELVKKAIELDDMNGYSHAVLGFLFLLIKQYDQAIAESERGITLNPNVADIHAWRALTLRFMGMSEEALREYKKAIRINPIPPSWYLHGLAMTYCWIGRYEEAITECEKAISQDPNSLYAHIAMTVIYSLSGRGEKARSEAAEVLRIHPKFSLNKYEKRVRYKNQEDTDRYIGALRKAGLK